jgi:sec-independent protein translocase protein TatB
MDVGILGVGPFELILILVIALIILGPERMISASRGFARFIRKLLTSSTWRTVQDVQQEIRTIPNQLLREAGLEDIDKVVPTAEEISKEAGLDQLNRDVKKIQSEMAEWSSEAPTIQPPPPKPAPPASVPTQTAESQPTTPPSSGSSS